MRNGSTAGLHVRAASCSVVRLGRSWRSAQVRRASSMDWLSLDGLPGMITAIAASRQCRIASRGSLAKQIQRFLHLPQLEKDLPEIVLSLWPIRMNLQRPPEAGNGGRVFLSGAFRTAGRIPRASQFRVELERSLIRGARSRKLPECLQGVAQVAVQVRVIGHQDDRPLQKGDGFFGPPQYLQDLPRAARARACSGVAVYGPAKALRGRPHLPLRPVDVAEIVVRGGVTGISRQGLLVRRNRVVETPLLLQ